MRKEATTYLNRWCQTPMEAQTHDSDEPQIVEQLQVQ